MFKKVVRMAIAAGLLTAGYAGYVRAFARVAAWARPHLHVVVIPHPEPTGSLTEQMAIELARKTFGAGHWTAADKLGWRAYKADRGYYIYAQNYQRTADGKEMKFWPFALIWQSKDGKNLKSMVADEALVRFSEPVGNFKPGARAGKVVFASVSGGVHMADDKGTPGAPADDTTVAVPYLQFTDATQQITSDARAVIHDPDFEANGLGLKLQLRPNEPGRAGFNGVQAAFLMTDVEILVRDVGKSGILPGTAQGTESGPATPLHLTAAGGAQFPALQIDFPPPPPTPRAGEPPAPAPPSAPQYTVAQFDRKVIVQRGTDKPDQLNCDHLRLNLLPAEQPPAPPLAWVGEWDRAPEGGPLSDLTLREALATGHAVWLQSPAEGLLARGNQLIHKKLLPERPDETYFGGDQYVEVEKVDLYGPEAGKLKGQIRSIDTIRTVDVMIFDNEPGGDPSSVVARGAGTLETRPGRDGPVERSASWSQKLEVLTQGEGDASRRILTLYGSPKVADAKGGLTLQARDKIIAWLKPRPDAPAAEQAKEKEDESEADSRASRFQIEAVQAHGRVRLVQGPDEAHPDVPRRTMSARDRLDVEFLPAPAPAAAVVAAIPAPAAPALAPAEPKEPEAVASAAPEELPAAVEATPVDPPTDLRAHYVWARLRQLPDDGTAPPPKAEEAGPLGGGRWGVEEARLRGDVVFRQDPERGQTRGTDVIGDALDLVRQDGATPAGASAGRVADLFQFVVHGPKGERAEVAREDFRIEAPVIEFDQAADLSRARGSGALTMLVQGGAAAPGLGPDDPAKARGKAKADDILPAAAPEKMPVTIAWGEEMEFHGTSDHEDGLGPGWAEFLGGVRVVTPDSDVTCREMTAELDRPVSFARSASRPTGGGPAADSRPDIARVFCREDVTLINRKMLDAEEGIVQELQRITGDDLVYERSTDRFWIKGAGTVRLYSRGDDQAAGSPGPTPTALTRRTSASSGQPKEKAKTKAKGKGQARDDAPAVPPMTMTRIEFLGGLTGYYKPDRTGAEPEPRRIKAAGDVQVLHARVADEAADLDFDRRPPDFVFLTTQYLEAESLPSGRKDVPARNIMRATGESQAETKGTTIWGDQITYDSIKELFHVEAYKGRNVSITRVEQRGQPAPPVTGQAARYNRRTGEAYVANPQSIGFVLPKSGFRPYTPPPEDPKKKDLRPRLKLPGRSNKERRSANGR